MKSMNEPNEIGNQAVSIQGPALGAGTITTPLISAREFRGRAQAAGAKDSPGSQRAAFAGLFLFTLLLYIRPNELFPEVFGTFPLARIVAVLAILAYVGAKLGGGERLTIMPLELKMLGIITLLGVMFAPLSASPQDSIDVLLDLFLKVGIIFVLMINVIDSRERLRSILTLVVICGTLFAALAIKSYLVGEFTIVEKKDVGVVGLRITGAVGGFFGNPNDLATTLNMLLPLAVALTLLSEGVKRAFYAACAAILIGGVIVTFSRGGFLGLLAMGVVLLWKVGSQNRAVTALTFALIFGVFVIAMPGGYGGRISSIFNVAEDKTGSTEARRDLLERAASVAVHHPIVGVGMGNYHIYSVHEQVAHNSYLETAAELGFGGLLAYLVFIFAPLRSLIRIERANATPKGHSARVGTRDPNRELRYLCIAMQTTLFAYIVCSSFGSIQYQWFLYYPVAYAIALRQINASESASSAVQSVLATSTTERGVLFKKNQIRPAQVSALNKG
jgi:O-antigen ligase